MSHAVLLALAATTAAGLATVLGSLPAVFARRPDPRLLAFGLGFAGGAMVYVALGELLHESAAAFSHAGTPLPAPLATALAFAAGLLTMALIARLTPHPHALRASRPGAAAPATGERKTLHRIGLLTLVAVTAHNFPEGLATFFATLEDPAVGLPLTLAIAIHNLPEGIAIALPLYFATGSRWRAVAASLLSGLAEPVGALLGYAALAGRLNAGVSGTVSGLVAGMMVLLALNELLPAARRHARAHEASLGLLAGLIVTSLGLAAFAG